jgi:DNA helicase-2/ATP-dependent DNA helicase PcrA
MLSGENVQLKNIANWLLDMANEAQISPLDVMFDRLIGTAEESESFSSPFRRFYFSKESYNQSPRDYLQLLSSLHTLKKTVAAYGARINSPRLSTLVDCIDVYQKNNLAITDTSPYLSGTNAVSLLTAHKAKGLEFDTVFVINCQNDIWAKSQNRDMIAFPKNLPIDPSGDTLDDFLRIFFVALTRAKRHLYVTSYIQEDSGKDSLRVPFLEPSLFSNFNFKMQSEHKKSGLPDTARALEKNVFAKIGPIAIDERPVLQPLLDSYVMSVTHLNNFLDIKRGGPHHFFEQNFLRFPQAKLAHTSYGTAMHETIRDIYIHQKNTGKKISVAEAQEIFKERLAQQTMSDQDFKNYLEQGNAIWKIYIEKEGERISSSHWIETDFKTQNVMIDSVPITGKVDKIIPNEQNKTLQVCDFKTGKPQKDWDAQDPDKKMQLHNYKRQLIFYKLLVEGSRDFSMYTVHDGYLEFLNPTHNKEIITLSYTITENDVDRLKKLIIAVYNKIQQLDFVEIDAYQKNIQGVIQFENDLIHGVI